MSKHTPQIEHKKRKGTGGSPRTWRIDARPEACEQRRLAKRKHPVMMDLDTIRESVQQEPIQRMSRKDRRSARRAAYRKEADMCNH